MMKNTYLLGVIAYLAGVIVLVALVGSYLISEKNSLDSVSIVDERELADSLVESGMRFFKDSVSENLLEERVLVVTSGVNAYLSHQLISQLILLDRQSSSEPIDLYIRTEGGWEGDAFAIIETIRQIQAPVNIHAIGEAHSSGLMIFVAATGRRIVYPNTILGYHALGFDEDEIYMDRYLKLWEDFAELPQEWLDNRQAEMFYFNAEQALEYKVADQLQSRP